jgi:UDP-N-acetylmuramate--alanine ligase
LGVNGRVLTHIGHVHLVGIGGIGMSGVAELLVNLGYEVTGSDVSLSPVTSRLESLGVKCAEGHDAKHVVGAELVVVSTAVPTDNPERVAAVSLGVPIVSRGAMLAELTSLKRTVAVVGSHGKTTTTAMAAVVLAAAGLDPTAVIGGRLSTFGSNTRFGRGDFMVVEGDESDRSFLRLSPEIAVLTNIDDEHLEAYDGMADLEGAFLAFAQRTAIRGCVVACVDDPRLRRVVSQIEGRVVTYGIDDASAHVRATDIQCDPDRSRFRVLLSGSHHDTEAIHVSVASPGRHNVENALAAVAVGIELQVPRDTLALALSGFSGVDRRFQVCGEVDGVVVIDDYAHHPTEIVAVMATLRLRTIGRLRVVFQPHRYSRISRLLDRFGEALSAADELILTEVYAAGEVPIPGANADAVEQAVARFGRVPVRRVTTLDEVVTLVTRDAQPGDVVVTLGAGSIGAVPLRIVDALRARRQRMTTH